MNINLRITIGLLLSSMIVAYLIVTDVERRNDGVAIKTSEKVGIVVFSLWAFAILLDVLIKKGYTFTVVRGLDMSL